MNSLPDPSKKTSINSLLNPEATASSFPTQPDPSLSAQSPHQRPVEIRRASFANESSFHLRAADWGSTDASAARRQEYYDSQYHHQHHIGSPTHYMSFPPPPRTCGNYEDVYTEETSQMWQVHQNSGYGASTMAPMYSDERSGSSPPRMSHEWQVQERASIRLSARESMQDLRYRNSPYYHHSPNGACDSLACASSQHGTQHHQMPAPVLVDPQYQAPRVIQSKRSTPEDSASEAGMRAKRSKQAGPKASVSSKRNSNTSKRNGATQQTQWMPANHCTPDPENKGKHRSPDSPTTLVPTETTNSTTLHAELQTARCMSNKYRNEAFPRCVSCTRRWAGDTCRFQGIRFFVRDAQGGIVGISFVETSNKNDRPTVNFPKLWNTTLTAYHIKRTKRTIAAALLPVLQKEHKHLDLPELIHRPRESDVRATCDTCMTSIFSTSWMCRICGREACAECFVTVKELTEDLPESNNEAVSVIRSRREKHAHDNPFFLACTRRNEHQSRDFSPMSRFCIRELRMAIEEMEKLLPENLHNLVGEAQVSVKEGESEWALQQNNATMAAERLLAEDHSEKCGDHHFPSNFYIPPNVSETVRNTPTHPLRQYRDCELTETNFPSIWASGQPLIVTDVLAKFKIPWTPEYFVEQYGTQSCVIIECQTEVNKRITVGDFFAGFGKYEGRKECWKLKDWPSSTDFRLAFPELYDDFSQAVPVPSYVRRDGVLNLASHFPGNTVAPDLGPKMYNAMASSRGPGSKGSTRLHMDMADALNIMTFATPCADGSPGCAVWDLFRAEDSGKLRTFLSKKLVLSKTSNGNGVTPGSSSRRSGALGQDLSVVTDPIHGQQFYLDEKLMLELFEETGVMSYRFYQRPGEAVFIPAGCAHQVANLADCIKVAIDFVSPENIERCEILTKEFREQNQRKVWKEDVLQLRTMMWFAWLSCRQREPNKESENRLLTL